MTDVVTIVFDHGVSAQAVGALAQARGWRPTGDTPRGHDVLASRRYVADDDTEILHGEDHNGACRFLRVEGKRAAAIEGEVRAALSCVTSAQVLTRLAEGDAIACIRTAGMLMRMRPTTFDARHFEALRALLTHDEVSVRRAGIRAAYGCRWPELVDFVLDQVQRKQRPQPGLEALLVWLQSPVEGDD